VSTLQFAAPATVRSDEGRDIYVSICDAGAVPILILPKPARIAEAGRVRRGRVESAPAPITVVAMR
jgi:hypothetical protein